MKQGTFNVDFYLWMRFAGGGEGQTQVQFPALLDRGAFDPARPLQTGEEDGLNYRLYRINGDFKARYELHDYPFDTQQLFLHFRNTQQRQELVTYVIDRFGLRLADERSSLVEDGAYSGLELWRFLRLRYFVDTLSSGSTLGKAALFDSGLKTEFAGFDTRCDCALARAQRLTAGAICIEPHPFPKLFPFGTKSSGSEQTEFAFGPAGSDPATWTWQPMTYNTDVGNNDEYRIDFTPESLQQDDKDFALRPGMSVTPEVTVK